MKNFSKILGLVIVMVFLSCSTEVGTGVLLHQAQDKDLLSKELKEVPFLFGQDAYWLVSMKSGDTINAVLPDYINKVSGDSVIVSVEGKNDFVTAK